MNIIVKGYGRTTKQPDMILLSFDFQTKKRTYEQALSEGVANVEKYFELLKKLSFETKNVKTRSFKVSEARVYDEKLKKYVFDGFNFNQSAKLEFDFDVKRLSELMYETSLQENPPIYRINFTVKDNLELESTVIELAYKDAEFQAGAIAKAAGKNLKGCIKTSFQPFDSDPISATEYGGVNRRMEYAKSASFTPSAIETVFTPEDVEIDKEIYCEFLAE